MPFEGTILVDTNVILEAHFKGCWKALSGAFQLETVEQCVVETQTGGQFRRPELRIDEVSLRASFKAVHPVSQLQIAKVISAGGDSLDVGEQALWAHALDRQDAWVLCGPDKASMKFGFQNGHRTQLISLGELLSKIKFNASLRRHFEKAWLDAFLRDLVLGVL
ncbi:MAG: hypothetical protein ACK47C_10255 [Paracoccaceae bacterium]|jgi:hypothetical protein